MPPVNPADDPFYQAAIEADQSKYWEPMDALESVASGFDDPKIVQLGIEKRHTPQIECEMFDYLDETPIPAIPWLFGRWIIRREATVIISPGGVGKSTLCAGIAHSLMSGLEFMGQRVWAGKHKVWLMNLEDDRDQMRRAIKSTFIHHKPNIEDCHGSMFFTSGMTNSLVTAYETKTGAIIHEPVFDDLKANIDRNHISTIIVDPFVSSHKVNENDNVIIDEIAKRWKRLAYETNCAVVLVHHTRKGSGEALSADSARGASALVNAARVVLTLNVLDDDKAAKWRIPDDERRRYFSVDSAKNNRSPDASLKWFKLVGVPLGNAEPDYPDGDWIGVAEPFAPPDDFEGVTRFDLMNVQRRIAEGEYRYDVRSNDWAGFIVAEICGLDPKNDRSRIRSIIDKWVNEGCFKIVKKPNENRKERDFLEVDQWVSE